MQFITITNFRMEVDKNIVILFIPSKYQIYYEKTISEKFCLLPILNSGTNLFRIVHLNLSAFHLVKKMNWNNITSLLKAESSSFWSCWQSYVVMYGIKDNLRPPTNGLLEYKVSVKLIWKQKVTRIRINWELNVENYLNLDLVWVFQSQWKQSVVRFFTRHKWTEEYLHLYLELEWIIRKYEMKYSELVRLRQSNYRNLLQPNKSFNSIYCTFKYWLIHHVTIVGWITDGWGKVSIQKFTIVFDDCK